MMQEKRLSRILGIYRSNPSGSVLKVWKSYPESFYKKLVNKRFFLKIRDNPTFGITGFSYPVFLPFRAVFLQTRKEEAYTSSFSSSASFNLMAPSMTPSTMGRYFSGQSCNLWLVRWRCSLSSRSSSGLK